MFKEVHKVCNCEYGSFTKEIRQVKVATLRNREHQGLLTGSMMLRAINKIMLDCDLTLASLTEWEVPLFIGKPQVILVWPTHR